MILCLIFQEAVRGYDTFSDAVVCAPNEEAARLIHPRNGDPYDGPVTWKDNHWHDEGCQQDCAKDASDQCGRNREWAAPRLVAVQLIGTAMPGVKEGVVCASFHAG